MGNVAVGSQDLNEMQDLKQTVFERDEKIRDLEEEIESNVARSYLASVAH
jgi:hypothetical protein